MMLELRRHIWVPNEDGDYAYKCLRCKIKAHNHLGSWFAPPCDQNKEKPN